MRVDYIYIAYVVQKSRKGLKNPRRNMYRLLLYQLVSSKSRSELYVRCLHQESDSTFVVME